MGRGKARGCWRWRPLFEQGEVLPALELFVLDITDAGVAKVS